MDMKTLLLTSLQRLSKEHTLTTLGDRSNYLGASDIGNCPRKVIFERLHPAEHDLATLLRFQRGHMAEDLVASAMTAAGYDNYDRQVEAIASATTPIKVHIDFVFTTTQPKVKAILEVKSVSSLPDVPYASWESQLYMQMGALKEKYPDYQIKAALLAIDLGSGEIALFNGYTPEDCLYAGLLQRASRIWTDYQFMVQGHQRQPAIEPSLLCGYCHHLTTCPGFAGEEVPELANAAAELQELQEKEKSLKNQIEPRKADLFKIVNQAGHSIKANGTIFSKATRTRKSINISRLTEFLADHGCKADDFQETNSFSFLEIKRPKVTTIPKAA
jgi:CRISPR-associated exonuclease Cas4